MTLSTLPDSTIVYVTFRPKGCRLGYPLGGMVTDGSQDFAARSYSRLGREPTPYWARGYGRAAFCVPMSRYQKYMASPEWQAKRVQVMKRAKGKCERCRNAKATQVHHLTYKNLGDEPLEDLQAVCLSCHASYHPDKLDGRFVPVVEAGCEMCPNEMVEVFWEDRTCRTFCPRCGHSTTAHFPKRKRRPKDRVPGWLEGQRKAERAETRRLKREERDREVRASFTPGRASGLYRCVHCDAQVNVRRRWTHFKECST